MLDAIPHLRAFAISLTGNVTYADDLVQTALLRGLEYLDKFQAGTSMQAWLFTIQRNQLYTERREAEDRERAMAGIGGSCERATDIQVTARPVRS
jgi:RNA polymerase sigma-70 factor, ECF subfamily